MKSIEHYEQLAREAKAEGRKQWTFRDLREWLDALVASVNDDEIEGMTLDQLDCMPVVVRVATEDGCEVGALTSANVEDDHGDREALMLDGEFDAQPALGPSNDAGDALDNEIALAEWLADNACMFEPGPQRDEMDEFSITTAFYTSAVEPSAVEPYTGECFEDGEP